MRTKKPARHTDPDIHLYSKSPRLRFKYGSVTHDLFEHVTATKYSAEAIEDMLNSKVPWPLNESAAECSFEQAALKMAEAA